jgi:hypothetical protein
MEIRNDTKDKTAVPSLLNYFEKKNVQEHDHNNNNPIIYEQANTEL